MAGMQKTKANDCQSQYSTPACLYLSTWAEQSPWDMLTGSMNTSLAPSFFQYCSRYLAVTWVLRIWLSVMTATTFGWRFMCLVTSRGHVLAPGQEANRRRG